MLYQLNRSMIPGYINMERKILLLVVFNLCFYLTVFGQADPVSLSSTPNPAGWVRVPVGVMPVKTNVTIMKGDSISLDVAANSTKLTIDSGAVLNSTGDAAKGNNYTLQVGGAAAPGVDTLQNNGLFGSTTGANDGIILAIAPTSSSFKLAGAGTTAIAAIRPAASNKGLTFHLSQNATLNNAGLAFSALPLADTAAGSDNIIFNVDTSKTLALINPEGQMHGTNSDGKGGNYTYNIYGTLDLTATKDTQNFTPMYGSPASTLALNVNTTGLVKLGSGFNAAATGTSGGKAVFNIADGGLIDATNTTVMTMGANFFTTNGTGALKRRVDNNDVLFPVGAAGAGTGNSVSLNNKGVVTNFSVTVQSTAQNTLIPDVTRIVEKQWTITPDSAGVANVTVSPEWITADQATNFNPSIPVSVVNYNGTNRFEMKAAIGGQGTAANPFTAAAAGFTTFGVFTVEDAKPVTKFVVYPNPVSSIINLSFPLTGGEGTITVISTNGEKVFSSAVGSGITTWSASLSKLAPGAYVISMNDGGKINSAKFIKL